MKRSHRRQNSELREVCCFGSTKDSWDHDEVWQSHYAVTL